MKKIIKILLLCLPILCSAHPKEAYTWIMAPNYGIQFYQNQDITTFRLDTLKFREYPANRVYFSVISDTNGILKYYTSGNFVFDINSDKIPNTYQLIYANTYSWMSMIVRKHINLIDFYYLNSK